MMNWREREALKEKQRREEVIRKAEEERMRGLRVNDTNFPSLGGTSVAKPKPLTNSGLFAKMASEWKKQSELDAFREQQRKEEEAREARRYASYRMSRFSPQPEDTYPPEEDRLEPPPVDADGWQTVETKKTRPPRDLTIEEMEERDRIRDEEEQRAYEDYEQNANIGEYYRRDHN